MPRIPIRRTKVPFTGQIDVPTFVRVEELARFYNRSMASVVRALLRLGLADLAAGSPLFPPHEDDTL